jgi:hypothetical protein
MFLVPSVAGETANNRRAAVARQQPLGRDATLKTVVLISYPLVAVQIAGGHRVDVLLPWPKVKSSRMWFGDAA